MPYINSVKKYVKGGYYHIYSKTLNNKVLFYKEKDCLKFMGLLYRYLVKPKFLNKRNHKIYYKRIDLLCFCLMDNHIHLLLKQKDNEKVIAEFMQSLMISYTRYYNDNYPHEGPIFHGVYRARLIQNEQDLIGVSRYIHLNPSPKKPIKALLYPYSSVRCYIKDKDSSYEFIITKAIMDYFHNSSQKYQNFLKA